MTGQTISPERVRALLSYDCSTGVFTWIARTSNRVRTGAIAGTLTNHGYIVISLDGGRYLAHRLAWLYVTGVFPVDEVDHKNGISTDNRWINLRDVTSAINRENVRAARRDNSTGVLGVRKMRGNFQANIRINGRMTSLGMHRTAQRAHEAYVQAKRRYHAGNTL